MANASCSALLTAAVVALGVGGAAASAADPEPASVSVRPESSVVARGARLRVAVKVRNADEQALGGSVGGSVVVTLRPTSGGRVFRREVIVVPNNEGNRDVTIGFNIPRSANTGRYRLRAVLLGGDGDSSTAYAHADPVLVRVR